jgi:quinol-cytochrome oxidoreductase complex cytochrome b subunit
VYTVSGMDKWSLFFGLVGLVSLLLAIPLGIIATLLAPKVADWWATTSKVRAFVRYKKLGREIAYLRRGSEFNALSRCIGDVFMSFLALIYSIILYLHFLHLNSLYIAAKNGMTLQSPINIGEVEKMGRSLQLQVICFLFLGGFFATFAAFGTRLISTTRRKRYVAKLRYRRAAIRKRLRLVDNSG